MVKNNIDEILCKKGIPREQMARDLNTFLATISRWINNKRSMSIEWAVKIAYYLDVSLDDLFYYCDDEDDNNKGE